MGFTRGFLLLFALLYYFDQQGILLWVVLAAAIHEMGHFIAITATGGKVKNVTFSCVGVEMALSPRCPLFGAKLVFAIMAGPLANLGMALVVWVFGQPLGEEGLLFWSLNVGLALFNLLPVAQLDGGRLLWQCTTVGAGSSMVEGFLWVLSLYLSFLLVIGGILLWLFGDGSGTLLITALWLFVTAVGRGMGSRKKGSKKMKIFLAFSPFV